MTAHYKAFLRSIFRRSNPEYSSAIALLACLLLAVGSIILGTIEDSLTIRTNGWISAIDIATAMLFLAAVRRSTRRADVIFNYGYGKYESLAILVSAALLIALSVYTLFQVVAVITDAQGEHNTPVLLIWSLLSFMVMRLTARLLERYADRYHLPMLRYDAALWRVDSYVELGVLASIAIGGILSVANFPLGVSIVDAGASILLILITITVPLTHGTDALKQLLDRTLPENMQFEILAIISANINSMCQFREVHTRQSGKDIFVEIDVVMPFDMTLEQLYQREQEILRSIHERFPTAIPRVYVTPCDKSCQTSLPCHLRPDGKNLIGLE